MSDQLSSPLLISEAKDIFRDKRLWLFGLGLIAAAKIGFFLIASSQKNKACQGLNCNSNRSEGLGIDLILERSRLGMSRLSPTDTQAAVSRGALLIDTRTETQRKRQGELPGALVIDRTVLEWRLDPRSDHKIPEVEDYDQEVVVVCRQGYSSSLAAASLRAIGLWRATDMIGGFEAWVAAGLPISEGPADVRL